MAYHVNSCDYGPYHIKTTWGSAQRNWFESIVPVFKTWPLFEIIKNLHKKCPSHNFKHFHSLSCTHAQNTQSNFKTSFFNLFDQTCIPKIKSYRSLLSYYIRSRQDRIKQVFRKFIQLILWQSAVPCFTHCLHDAEWDIQHWWFEVFVADL